MSRAKLPAHPMNSPGPFYVENGCCISCGVPESEAPDLFSSHDAHCYVRQQPHSPDHLDQIMNAMLWSEVDCIRYRGTDQNLIQRLGENGLLEQVDFGPENPISPVYRNHVSFEINQKHQPTPLNLAKEYHRHLQNERAYTYRGPHQEFLSNTAWLEYSWYQEKYHRITFRRALWSRIFWIHMEQSIATQALARDVHNWLKVRPNIVNPRWFSDQQLKAGATEGQDKPT